MTRTTENCPWCGSAISRTKFEEISAKIREDERKKHQEREAVIQKQYQERLLTTLERERIKAVEGEKERWEKSTKQLKDDLTSLKRDRDQARQTIKEATEREAKLKEQLAEQAAKEKKKELDEQRLILDRDHQKQVASLRAEFARERERTKQNVEKLERQLNKQTANDLGDGAEIDLYEALRDAFPNDQIRRVRKGEAGADIHHEVVHRGQCCGLILFDSKNRQSWQRAFATKLHEDQIAAGAVHAVLATRAFPAGRRELCIEDDVILVNPARAIHVVQILRAALVKMHTLGLSKKKHESKVEDLYRWFTSDRYTQTFGEVDRLAKEILNLDVQEQKAHQLTWQKRGRCATRMSGILSEIDTEISHILEGALEGVAADGETPF